MRKKLRTIVSLHWIPNKSLIKEILSTCLQIIELCLKGEEIFPDNPKLTEQIISDINLNDITTYKEYLESVSFLPYTLGGDKNVVPQVEAMAKSLMNNLENFDEAFNALWNALKSFYTLEVVFFINSLLGNRKLRLYDLDTLHQEEDKKIINRKIINSINYLYEGKNNSDLFPETEKIIPANEVQISNLKHFILSDYPWGKETQQSMDEYLKVLRISVEDHEKFNKKKFIEVCNKFSNLLSDVSMGRKSKEENLFQKS